MTEPKQASAESSSGQEPAFRPARAQDAWGTIRGFVYQVNLTIDRWLSLPEDAVLELEHGEDIDHILAAANAESDQGGPDDPERLLEQIKHLGTNVTLRHASVGKAICDFLAHRAENPDLELRFKYTTNASAGVERPPALASMPKVGAIHLWQALHSGHALPNGITESQALDGIRSILQSAVRPEAVTHDEDWKRFQQLVANKGDVARLVQDFEWGTDQAQHADLAGTLRQKLLQLRHAQDANEAKEQHERLFLSVFNKLSEQGLKQLHAADLGRALTTPPTNQRKTRLLGLLVGWFEELKATVEKHDRRLDDNDKRIEEIAKGLDAAVQIQKVVAVPETTPPPHLERGCKRSTLIDAIIDGFAADRWLAINGPIASGKSELALLITDRFPPCLWIQLRGLTEREACLRIDTIVNAALKLGPDDSWLLADVMATQAALSGFGVVVLDDIQALSEGDLSRRVLRLVQACTPTATRLITTSNNAVSPAVSGRAGSTLIEYSAPAFNDEEARELLTLHGMPKNWPDKRVEFIRAHSSGNPAILTTVAIYLQQVGWEDDATWFTDLVTGDFGHELNDDTVTRLLGTVADSQAKELLFRLREAIGNVTNEQIALVANVPPPILAPLERLAALNGLWLQRTAKGHFAVSPLIKRLGSSNLSAETRRATNAALAGQILRQKTIDQYQGSTALAHLVVAEDWDRAAILLAQAHMQAAQAGIKRSDFPLLQAWASTPLPTDMGAPFRLFIRALQLGNDDRSEEQTQLYLSDIRTLLDIVDDEHNWAVAAVAVYAGTDLPQHDLELAIKIQVRAATYTDNVLFEKGEEPGLAVGLGSMIWFSVGEIKTFAEIESFLTAIEGIPKAILARAAVGDVAAQAQQILARRLWLAECDLDEADRNWPGVLEKLEAIRNRAVTLGLVWLRVCTDTTRMIVQAEHLKNINTAVAIAEDSLKAKDLDEDQRFMLEQCIGRQHLHADDHDTARTLLTRALKRNGELFQDERVVASICLSKALASDDTAKALETAHATVKLSEQFAGMPGLFHVKALGELAIAQHYHAGPRAAYDTLEQAANRLLEEHSEQNEWKVLLRCLLQAMLNLIHDASGNTGPIDTSVMTPISRGMMLALGTPQLIAMHTDNTEHGLFTVMGMLAETLGLDQQACHWAYRALQPPRGQPNVLTLSTSMPKVLPGLLSQRRYPEALDAAITACSGFVAAKILHETGRDGELETAAPSEVLAQAGQEGSRRLNEITLQMFLIPASASIAHLNLDDPETARAGARELAGLFRQLAVRESSSEWEQAAALMTAFADGSSAQQLVKMSNENGDPVFQASGYMLASTLESISINSAWHVQDEALKWLDDKWRRGSPLIYRMIVLPFIESFWRDRVENQQFTPPGPIPGRFAEAMTADDDNRARAILSAVAFGLTLT